MHSDRNDSSHADVIVIGAGHNGLTTACYLARTGLDVLVLESRDIVGGMTTTESPIAEAPDHRLNVSGIHYLFFKVATVAADLGLHRYGFQLMEVDPAHATLDPDGGSIAMWRDPRRAADDIARFSRHDATAYLELVHTVDAVLDMGYPMLRGPVSPPGPSALLRSAGAVARHVRHIPEIAGLTTSNLFDVITERFHHPLVQAMMASQVQGNEESGSGATSILFAWLHRFGSWRPVGGTGAIADALSQCLLDLKGRIRTSAPVEGLLVEGRRVCGVRLENGDELRARAVVGACDPHQTLAKLLPAGTLPDRLERRARQIPTHFSGGTQMKIDMAMSGQITMKRHNTWRKDGLDLRIPVLYQGSLEQQLIANQNVRRGGLGEFTPYAATVPTALDPTQAPKGQDTVWVWAMPLPYEPTVPMDVYSKSVQATVLSDLGRYYDGLERLEIGRHVETWVDLQERTRAPMGNWAHVDFQLFRNGPLRPARGFSHRTPVDGLFITGAGTHPGPGISGIPGQLAARAVLKSFRRGPKRDRDLA